MRQVGEFNATHAWLEQDGLVVDITADQFADVDHAVVVGFESAWHRLWSPIGGDSVALLAFYEGDDYRELVPEICVIVDGRTRRGTRMRTAAGSLLDGANLGQASPEDGLRGRRFRGGAMVAGIAAP